MTEEFKPLFQITCHSFRVVVRSVATLLILSSAQAQNLFESDDQSGNIYEFTPDGVRSTFASGISLPAALAFNSSGDLFVSSSPGTIYEFTPSGVQSTFAQWSGSPTALAFNSADDLFVTDFSAGTIYEFTPNEVQSTFASGLPGSEALAFDNEGDLFASGYFGGDIYEFTPDGTQSTFASGLTIPYGLAFQPAPEPSVLALLVFSTTALLVCYRRNLLRC